MGNGPYRPKIEVIDVETACTQCPDLQEYIAGEEAHPQSRTTGVLKISVEVEIPGTPIEAQTAQGEVMVHTDEQAAAIHNLFLRSEFEKRVYDLVVVTNIARIGSLGIQSGLLVQDEEVKSETDSMGRIYLFQNALALSSSIG